MMPTLTIVLLFLVYGRPFSFPPSSFLNFNWKHSSALQIKSQTPEKAASQEAEQGSGDYQSPPQLSSGQQEDDVEAYESADPNKRENEPKPKTLEYTKSRRMKSRSKRHGSQNAYFQGD